VPAAGTKSNRLAPALPVVSLMFVTPLVVRKSDMGPGSEKEMDTGPAI
jgi:hypothetical protein